jgi:hypothetical protein
MRSVLRRSARAITFHVQRALESVIAKSLPILFKDLLHPGGEIGATASADAGPWYLTRLIRAAKIRLQRFADNRRNGNTATATLLLEMHIQVIRNDE